MLQGNVCYRLLSSQNYRPGATGATAGPQPKELPISGVFVAAGAATLDFFDANNNRNIITFSSGNLGTYLPISLTATGSTLTGNIFGFSPGNVYGNS
jgi:hypothetical protein